MKRILSMLIVIMMMVGSFGVIVSGLPEESVNAGAGYISPVALATHSAIRIDSDSGFTAANGVTGGNGTDTNPYIIDNWTIDGNGKGYAIYIGNTTAHFIIRNCSVSGASGVSSEPYFADSNIILYNVTNGTVYNVTSSGASNNGIYLTGWSGGNRVFNNTVYSNRYGIVIYKGNNTFIWNNSVDKNTRDGIRLDTGHMNTIWNNNVTDNGNIGIYLFQYFYNTTVYENTVTSSGNYGISAERSDYNTIEDNVVRSSTHAGIYLAYSSHNRIGGNNISSNEDGIKIENYCSYNMIENNNASYNSMKGIYLNYWDSYNSIMNNTAIHNQNHDGITVYRSNYTDIVNNTLISNGRSGLNLQYTNNTYASGIVSDLNSNYEIYTLYDNHTVINGSKATCGYTGSYAMYSEQSSNLLLYGSSFGMSRNQILYFRYGSNISVERCTVYNASYYNGVYSYYAKGFRISNSTVENIASIGIDVIGSSNVIMYGNTLINCTSYSIYTTQNSNTFTWIMNNTIFGSNIGIYLGATNATVTGNRMFNTGLFIQSWDSRDIVENNTVNGRPVFYAYHESYFTVPSGAGEVLLAWCTHYLIEGQNLSDGSVGIQAYYSTYGKISNNTIHNNHVYGIWNYGGGNSEISNNSISNSSEQRDTASSLYLAYTRYNSINDNTIFDSNIGIYVDYSAGSNTYRGNSLIDDGFFFKIYSTNNGGNDIDLSNTVNGKPVYYLDGQNGTSVPAYSAGEVICYSSSNISIGPQKIGNSTVGVQIILSSNVSMSGTSIRDEAMYGVSISRSSNVKISDCTMINTQSYTIYDYHSENTNVKGSEIKDSARGPIYSVSSTYLDVHDCDITNSSGSLYLYQVSHSSVHDNNISTRASAIYAPTSLSRDGYIEIYNNTISKIGSRSYVAITFSYMNTGYIYGNTIRGFGTGLNLYSSSNIDIYANTFYSNYNCVNIYRNYNYGPYIASRIYHNNFINNNLVAYAPYNDSFNMTYPEGGNYYSQYHGVDYFSGPNQDILGSDGIGDTAYSVGSGSTDYYPLIFPYGSTPKYLANSSWPMLGHDMWHTGATDVNGPLTDTPYWNFSTSDAVYSSASVGPDGTIYFGSMNHDLYALNTDGSLKWKFTAGGNITSAPAISEDGTIYFGSADGRLYALYPNGTEKWNDSFFNPILASPVIGTDGTVYVGDSGGYINAIDIYGTLLWRHYIGNNVQPSSPAIGHDGTIYFSELDTTQAIYASNASLKWTYTQPGNVSTPPTIYWNGSSDIILVGSDSGNISAIAPNGTYLGGDDLDGAIRGVAVHGSVIYITTANGTLYAVDFDTGPLWEFSADGPITGAPAIDSRGSIYFTTTNGTIYSVDSGGSQIWNHTVQSNLRSYPSLGNGLFFAGGDGGLYCMGDIIPPTVSISSPGDGQIIESDSVSVTWTGGDSESGLDHYEISIDGSAPLDVGNVTQHTFSGLADGHHTVSVTAFDRAGNTAEDNVSFIIDTYPPVLSITSPLSGAILNLSSQTITWVGSDNGSGIDHYEISIDGGAWTDVGTNESYSSAYSVGNHTVEVRAYDRAGRNSTDSVSFMVDYMPPSVEITSPSEPYLSSDSELTLVWKGSDEGAGIFGYYIRMDDEAWIPVGMNTTYTYSFIEDGNHTIFVMAMDRAGNENTSVFSFMIDSRAPYLFIDSPENGSVQGSDVEIIWHAVDFLSGVTGYRIRIDGDDWIALNASVNHYTFMGLSEGTHVVEVSATDLAGNTNTTQVSFATDSTPPSVTANTPVGNDVPVNSTISVTFSENVVHSSVHLDVLAGNQSVSGTITWVNNTLIFTPSRHLPYATQHMVTVSGARDSVGNEMENYTWTFTTTNIGTVTGTVLDENGNPVSGATVTADTGQSTTTDANGNFSLDVPMGARTLTISKDGYDATTLNATVVPGESVNLPPVTLPKSSSLPSGMSMTYLLIGLLLLAVLIAAALFMKKKGGKGEPADEGETMPAGESVEGTTVEEASPAEEDYAGEELSEEAEIEPSATSPEGADTGFGETEAEGEDLSDLIE